MRKLLALIALLPLTAFAQQPPGVYVDTFWVEGDTNESHFCPGGTHTSGTTCWVRSEAGLVQYQFDSFYGIWRLIYAEEGDQYNPPFGLLGGFFDSDGNFAGWILIGQFNIFDMPNPWEMYDINPWCWDYYACTDQGSGMGN